jgi:molecular chaperone DnaJ
MARDYYRSLGVDRHATTEEIKKAFRRVARETHPDANPGDPESAARFREAAEAYEVLSDPDRRRRHDRGDSIDLTDFLGGFGGIDEVLRSVFGDGGLFGNRQARPARGRDLLVPGVVSLDQAAFGGEVTVEFQTRSTCGRCTGTGAEPGSARTSCADCGGSGQVRVTQRSLFGTMVTASECPRCRGEGSVVESPCTVCRGSGTISDQVEVNVEVPAGVGTGTRLRLSGRGDAVGARGTPGDLYVEITVADDPRFERHDNDLWHHLSLGIAEAALGTRAEIPLIDGGTIDLEVPPGTQPGEVFRLRGEGMTVLGRRMRGDLIVVAAVEIPKELTEEEEALLRRWAEMRGERTDRPASA